MLRVLRTTSRFQFCQLATIAQNHASVHGVSNVALLTQTVHAEAACVLCVTYEKPVANALLKEI